MIVVAMAGEPATWVIWVMIAVTAFRYVHAAGMITSPDLAKPHPLRFIGALGTYVGGLALCVALFLAG